MSHFLSYLFYQSIVNTVLIPLKSKAFHGTRSANISQTEAEALESGTVGFEAQFLGGKPNWSQLLDPPKAQLTEVEQAFLDGPTEKLCEMINDWEIRTQHFDLPASVWQFLKKQKFFGMIIPEEYGGLGFSALAHSTVIMKIASRSGTAAVTAMVPNSLGPAELILHYGTDAQKDDYLPRLASGEELPAFALTEPEAGSDAASMQSHGEIIKDSNRLCIKLSWNKRYITLGPVATLLGVAFKLDDPNALLGEKKSYGITLAIVPTGTAGVEIGRRHNPLGAPFMNGPTRGEDVIIPLENIIGGQKYIGQGWRMLMECLSVGRSTSLPALATGSAKLIARSVGAYSRVRKQFRISIGKFEGVEELLARISAYTYALEASRITTLQMLDAGERPSILSAIMKYHATEMGRQLINDGMDIMGGKAISEGPNNLLASMYHGVPIGITVEGANLLTRNMIIFGQGSVRSHPFVLKEMKAARGKDIRKAKREFTKLLAQHMDFSVRNILRSIRLGLGVFGKGTVPQGCGAEKQYFQQMNRLSAAYASLADVTLLVLGGALKRKERISALLGDTMSDLYLSSCVLRHYIINGRQKEETPLMHWACQHFLYQAEQSLDQLLLNFPSRVLAACLRPVVFPSGKKMKRPNHRLDHQVAQSIYKPGKLRESLSEGIFIPTDPSEALAQLDTALAARIASESIEKKISQAKRDGTLIQKALAPLIQEAFEKEIINQQELEQLKATEQACALATRVDDFNTEAYRPSPPEKLAIANKESLEKYYPSGTQWDLEIPEINLNQLFSNAFKTYANKPCIEFYGKRYQYKEIAEWVDKITIGLQSIGVKKGDKIGFYMPNTPYYPAIFYAALRCGAIIVNFCSMYTEHEIEKQAKASDTRIMISLNLNQFCEKCIQLKKKGIFDCVILCPMEDVLPFFKAKAFQFTQSDQITQAESPHPDKKPELISLRDISKTKGEFKPVNIAPDDTALIQFTELTTGAILSHRNLVANASQIEEFFKASPNKPHSKSLLNPGEERMLASIPFYHIFGLTVLMIATVNGGNELIILPDPRDIRETLKAINEKKPTLFPAVPRLLQSLAERSKTIPLDLSTLRTVISGGATLSPDVQYNFENAANHPGIIKQGYGLTEASPVVSSNPPYGANKPGSVGIPYPKTMIRICALGNPEKILTIGEEGEICIKGPQVIQGFYNNNEKTQAVLHDGWLRTGDIGYLDQDYYLYIVGRKKTLIIINGHNIYPQTIEENLLKHPDIASARVIGIPNKHSGEAAKAFIKLKDPSKEPPHVRDLKKFLGQFIHRMAIPRFFEFV